MEYHSPKGLLCPLVTPLTDQGKIDEASLKKLIIHVVPHVDGIILGESWIGEGLHIDSDGRDILLSVGMEVIQGRVPLITGITGNTVDETKDHISRVEYLKKKFNYGGEILLMDLPLWYHSNRDLPDHYRDLGEICGLPFVISNNPDLIKQLGKKIKRRDIRTSVLKKLSKNEQIVAMEFRGNLKRFFNYQKAVRGRDNFRFYDGSEVEFLTKPSSSGVVAPGANILPTDWQWIVKSSVHIHRQQSDDADQLWILGQKIWAFQRIYVLNPVATIKSALKYMGILDSDMISDKTPPITHPQRAQIYRLLIETGLAKSSSQLNQ